jgi:hypothetical protein
MNTTKKDLVIIQGDIVCFFTRKPLMVKKKAKIKSTAAKRPNPVVYILIKPASVRKTAARKAIG